MQVEIDISKESVTFHLRNIFRSVNYSLKPIKRMVITFLITSLILVVYLALTFPSYSIQMFKAGYWMVALGDLYQLFVESNGVIGLYLLNGYAILTGILLTAIGGQFWHQANEVSWTGLFTTLPAIFVAGCAGCGAGILGVIGAFGVLTSLPFGGNGLRFVNVLLVLAILSSVGNPQKCLLNPRPMVNLRF